MKIAYAFSWQTVKKLDLKLQRGEICFNCI